MQKSCSKATSFNTLCILFMIKAFTQISICDGWIDHETPFLGLME